MRATAMIVVVIFLLVVTGIQIHLFSVGLIQITIRDGLWHVHSDRHKRPFMALKTEQLQLTCESGLLILL